MPQNLFSDLTAQVASNPQAQASALHLLKGIASRIAAAGTNENKLNALVTDLNETVQRSSAAIFENTPALHYCEEPRQDPQGKHSFPTQEKEGDGDAGGDAGGTGGIDGKAAKKSAEVPTQVV